MFLRFSFFIVFLLTAAQGFAGETDTSNSFLSSSLDNRYISKGKWNLGISGNRSYSSVLGVEHSFSVQAHYFVSDTVALGIQYQQDFNSFSESWLVGPSVRYYFWKKNRWASYIGQSLLYSQTQYKSLPGYGWSLEGQSHLGISYYLNSNMSIGASYRLHYPLQRKGLNYNKVNHIEGAALLDFNFTF